MKKIVFAAYLFTIPVYPINIPQMPKIPTVNYERPQIPENDSSFGTFSDESFTKNEVNFSSGQMVYIKVEMESDKAESAVCTFSDANKNVIYTKNMEKIGGYYKTQFNTPDADGIYYVRVEITGEGLSFIGEKNINVGYVQGNVAVETNIENVVKGESTYSKGESDDSEKPTSYHQEKRPK